MCLIKIIVIIIVRPNTCHNICLAKIMIEIFITHKMIKKTQIYFLFLKQQNYQIGKTINGMWSKLPNSEVVNIIHA